MNVFKLFGHEAGTATNFSRNVELTFGIKPNVESQQQPRYGSSTARKIPKPSTTIFPELQTNNLASIHAVLSKEIPSINQLPKGEAPTHTALITTSAEKERLSQMTHWGAQPSGTQKLIQEAQLREESHQTLSKISLSPQEEKVYLASTIAVNALPFMAPKEAIDIALNGYQGNDTNWFGIASKFYDRASLTLTMSRASKTPKLNQQDLFQQREQYIAEAQNSGAHTPNNTIQAANHENISALPEGLLKIITSSLSNKNASNDHHIAQHNLTQNPAGKALVEWLDQVPNLKALHAPGIRMVAFPEDVDFSHADGYVPKAGLSVIAGSTPSALILSNKKPLKVSFIDNRLENKLLSSDGTQKTFPTHTTLGHEITHAYQRQADKNNHREPTLHTTKENHATLVERIIQYYEPTPQLRFPIYAADQEGRHEHLNSAAIESFE